MAAHWAYIAVGSNLGDRLGNCRQGLVALGAQAGVRIVATSPFYLTEPVDFQEQAWFVNAAVKIETDLAPADLLACLQDIQRRCGRAAQVVRFGPRILDLDIIFYDDLILDTPQLVIPHPRMHKRRFVLQPLCDIDPSVVHPVLHLDVQSLLEQTVMEGQAIKPCCDC